MKLINFTITWVAISPFKNNLQRFHFLNWILFKENFSMKITSQFLSDTVETNSIDFQKLSFKIAVLKLNKAFSIHIDETLFKNLLYIMDNLLLSLRMAEKYSEAIEVLDEFNDFLKQFNFDVKYMEVVILNWFKIKRDASKVQSKQLITIESTRNVYDESLKYKTVTKLLRTLNADHTIDYLFEELRIIKYFSTIDSSIQMHDEILCVLNEIRAYLEAKSAGDSTRHLNEITNKTTNTNNSNKSDASVNGHKIDLNLNKCRMYLEYAQFDWLKHKCTQNAYLKNSILSELNSEQCIDKASNLLKTHKCSSLPKPTSRPVKKCECVEYQILKFQLNLYKMLNDYAQHRDEICLSIKNLISLRLKLKVNENTLTNTDNLVHISTTQSSLKYLLCSEIHDNTSKSTDKQSHYLKLLENLYVNLCEIRMDAEVFQIRLTTLRKQLYGLIDLLAHLFGFFCIPTRKIDCLKLKLNYLSQEINMASTTSTSPPKVSTALCIVIPSNPTSSNDTYLTLLAITTLNLMKCYLNLHQFKQLNDLNVFLIDKSFDKCSIDGDYDSESFSIIEKHKVFVNKPEFICTYYLINAHYFLLKQNYSDAVKIILKKILNSAILSGRQTAPYYEAKYYLKYLLFILSTVNRM